MGMIERYPDWICGQCGLSLMDVPISDDMCSTFHEGKCGVCGLITMITEPRDFGYPDISKKDIDSMTVSIDCRLYLN